MRKLKARPQDSIRGWVKGAGELLSEDWRRMLLLEAVGIPVLFPCLWTGNQ